MVDINSLVIESLLVAGLDIEFSGVTLKNYKLKELFSKEIGLGVYLSTVNICTENPTEIFNNEEKRKQFLNFLNLFTNKKWDYYSNSSLFYVSDNPQVILSEDSVQYILDIFKRIYCMDDVPKESDREDISDSMRELLKEFEEEEKKVKEKKGNFITLMSIVKAVSCKHPSINLLNIWGYTMYQLMESYHYINQIDRENRTITAVYAGTVSSKDVKIEDMYWANEKASIKNKLNKNKQKKRSDV